MTHYLPHSGSTASTAPVTLTNGEKSWDWQSTAKTKTLVLRETQHMTEQMWHLETRLQELLVMLTYARPDGSKTEKEFIKTYIDTLPGVRKDDAGNRVIRVGDKNNVCWASHTDTVHWDEGRQEVRINNDGNFALGYDSKGSCLGADCTAGVWLMRRMILAGKQGLYIFHRGEERGGKGSKFLAKHGKALWKDIRFMISLDRKGKDSVITEQFGGITASRSFAHSIAPMLPAGFTVDPTGSFTDSASYSEVISECSNLSIGYEHCHTARETLDFNFTDKLLKHLLLLDYSKLVFSRDPKDKNNKKTYVYADNGYKGGSYGGDYYGGTWSGMDDDGWNGKTHSQPNIDRSYIPKPPYVAKSGKPYKPALKGLRKAPKTYWNDKVAR